MTNLSDLLPSGGGAKEATAIASGTLSNGQTVALLSNGQVEAVSETTATASLGSEAQFSPDISGSYDIDGFYYADQNAVVFVYQDTNNYLAAVAGTISGTTITFGTEQVGHSSNSQYINGAYSTTDNKAVVVYKDANITGDWKAKQLTVSGTTVTWESGSGQTVSNHGNYAIGIQYDPSSDRFLAVWPNNASPGNLYHNIGYISGTTTAWSGVYYNFGGTNYYGYFYTAPPALSYDPVHECIVIAISQNSGQQPMQAFAVSVSSAIWPASGATVFWGLQVIPNGSGATSYTGYNPYMAYDSENKQHNITWWDATNTNADLTTIKITGSNAATVATTVNMSTLLNVNTQSSNGIAYHPELKKVAVLWTDGSNYMKVVSVDTSNATSSNWTHGTTLDVENTNQYYRVRPIVYDSSSQNMAIGWREYPGGDGKGVVYTMDGTTTNVANFIGITSESITSGNSGKYNPQGGVATTTEPSAGETGTPTAFTGNIGAIDVTAAYDSGSNQVVFGFQNPATGHGSAIVGSINSSNNTNTLGAVGTYQALSSSYNAITYDASADKIVAVASNPTSSIYNGYAWVGTVSGSGITFGSGVNYNGSVAITAQDITYDSTSQVTVVCYKQYNDLYARVGTISGGAITFGSASSAAANSVSYINAIYDSNADRTVVACQVGGVGLGVIAGQVSGGTISWGTPLYPASANVVTAEGHTICFDSQNNKVVVPYQDTTDNLGKVVVCNVSGSTVTAGSPVPFTSAAISGNTLQSAFDSSLNKVIITYTESSDNFLRIITGTVSGTSISFDAPIVVTSAAINTTSTAIAYDSNANRTLISYRDQTSSFLGNAVVYVTAGTAGPLTIDSTYYIQNNGNITKTATGNTEIGKAVTTTQLLLKGAP